jgi:hypothetical protein
VRNAVALLGEMGVEQADTAMLPLLQHDDERIRVATARALVRLGTAKALHGLHAGVDDPNAEVRRMAAVSYGLAPSAAGGVRPPAARLAMALEKETDKASATRLEKVKEEQANLREKSSGLMAQWRNEKAIIDQVRSAQERIETLKGEAERAQSPTGQPGGDVRAVAAEAGPRASAGSATSSRMKLGPCGRPSSSRAVGAASTKALALCSLRSRLMRSGQLQS